MSHEDLERVERYKLQVRSMQDRKLIETFLFNGLTLGDMDRSELLGVICFLANNPNVYVRKTGDPCHADVLLEIANKV